MGRSNRLLAGTGWTKNVRRIRRAADVLIRQGIFRPQIQAVGALARDAVAGADSRLAYRNAVFEARRGLFDLFLTGASL